MATEPVVIVPLKVLSLPHWQCCHCPTDSAVIAPLTVHTFRAKAEAQEFAYKRDQTKLTPLFCTSHQKVRPKSMKRSASRAVIYKVVVLPILLYAYGYQSFRTQVISYLLWSFCTYFLVISYPVTTISCPGHFVPRSTVYKMTLWWSIRTQVISYPFWSFRTHFCHFVPSKDGWTEGRTGVFWLKW